MSSSVLFFFLTPVLMIPPLQSLVAGAKNSESGDPGWWQEVEEVFYTS